jgi:hypothetical protein
MRVAAGAFGFLIFSHVFDGSDLYGASDVQCPRCNGHGRPRIIALARHPSI